MPRAAACLVACRGLSAIHFPEKKMKISPKLASLVLAVAATPVCMASAHAGDLNEDSQIWTNISVSKPLSARWSYSGSAIYRRGQDWSEPTVSAVVPAIIGYKLSDSVTASLGYAYLYIPGRRPLHESRGLAQLSVNHGRWIGGSWDSVLTVEDRTVRESSDDAWRVRWRLRYRTKVPGWRIGDRPVGVAASIEPRLYLSNADWGPSDGYDATRHYVGLELPMSQSLRLDVGYFNHYAPRPGADTMNHAFSVALQINL